MVGQRVSYRLCLADLKGCLLDAWKTAETRAINRAETGNRGERREGYGLETSVQTNHHPSTFSLKIDINSSIRVFQRVDRGLEKMIIPVLYQSLSMKMHSESVNQ